MAAAKRVFPEVIIKDPSANSRWFEEHIQRQTQDAERRRRHQDTQAKLAQRRMGAGGVARMGSHRMITPDAPRLVLHYQKYGFDCLAEVTWVPKLSTPGEQEMMFTLVCPRCVLRKVPQGEAQLIVRESHRKFWIDDRPQNKRPTMVNMWGKEQQITPAGKVSVNDTVRCSNTGCGWTARITDSIVVEV